MWRRLSLVVLVAAALHAFGAAPAGAQIVTSNPKAWAIVLCKFSDVAAQPQPK
jgi:hypothetical protein